MHSHFLDAAPYLRSLSPVKSIQGMMNTCWHMTKSSFHPLISSGQYVLEMGVSMETPMLGSDVTPETSASFKWGVRAVRRGIHPLEHCSFDISSVRVSVLALCRMLRSEVPECCQVKQLGWNLGGGDGGTLKVGPGTWALQARREKAPKINATQKQFVGGLRSRCIQSSKTDNAFETSGELCVLRKCML